MLSVVLGKQPYRQTDMEPILVLFFDLKNHIGPIFTLWIGFVFMVKVALLSLGHIVAREYTKKYFMYNSKESCSCKGTVGSPISASHICIASRPNPLSVSS